ncbi:hypothetical protein [Actinosynnema mirum]|uniref:hypothetical protein n=1 Tax=Actinosynnema mirum TaxID=40567 RepID=UPI00019ACCD7|nr:hypothetical protein [Actinosynnema mirum]
MIWQELRWRSGVELGAIKLEGTHTWRRGTLGVTVDGIDTTALGVMIPTALQGLGLLLFRPKLRSTPAHSGS